MSKLKISLFQIAVMAAFVFSSLSSVALAHGGW